MVMHVTSNSRPLIFPYITYVCSGTELIRYQTKQMPKNFLASYVISLSIHHKTNANLLYKTKPVIFSELFGFLAIKVYQGLIYFAVACALLVVTALDVSSFANVGWGCLID